MTSLYEILKASKTGIASDLLTALRGRQYAASLIQERELEGVPPLLFKANGEPLIDWSIYGNTVQSGTPAPQSPVMPQGTGDKTKNLIDYKTIFSQFIDSNGDISTTANNIITWNSIPQEWVGKTITISCYVKSIDASYVRVQGQVDSEYINGNAINSGQTGYTEITITPVSTSDRWRITYGSGTVNVVINQVMLEESSTRTAYEPFGVKIPISSAGQTTPVYLGEVETSRQIEKIKLDELTWTYISTASYSGFYIYDYTTDLIEAAGGYCNKLVVHTGSFTSAPNNSITIFESSGRQRLFIRYDDAQGDTTALMAMLNGAVFYGVKTTPTTGIVNEPLMKIGNYVDSLTATQAGVEIPTNNGSTTIDVDTTVKPSKVYIKYKG